MNLFNFLRYNNAVPIAISVVLLGGGAAFAASDPSIVYSTSQEVISVDNSYLVNKDLALYSPRVEITGVTEDGDNYYAAYTLSTIDVEDAVWKDIVRKETMQVSKADLGPYRDLGVYVTEKMKDIIARELQRLKDTQKDERTHLSAKVVATEYGGLIGKFLDRTTEELPGYTPVIQEQPYDPGVESVPPALPGPVSEPVAGSTTSEPPQQVVETPTEVPSTSEPVLKVLGMNPAEIPTGAAYNDLGAVITSMPNNYGIHVFLDGAEVSQVSLDTTSEKEWTITYRATNQEGQTGEATRIVRVTNPYKTQQSVSDTPVPTEGTSQE